MTMTDPIADMLTRIRNAQLAFLVSVDIPYSKYKENILKVMQEEGYIANFTKVETDNNLSLLKVSLKYSDRKAVIKIIKRVSKPGRRIYSIIGDLRPYYGGYGTYILSTPSGVLAYHTAKTKNVGGEVICKIF